MAKEFLHQEFEVAQAGAGIKEGSRGSRIGKVFMTSFFVSSILLTVGAVAFTIIFFISMVDGSSMMLTLNAAYFDPSNKEVYDHVLVNRYIKPKKGDIIVVRHYWNPPVYDKKGKLVEMEYFIKRLIAVENDRVRFEKLGTNDYYSTIVNDKIIDEAYLDFQKFGLGKMTTYGDNIYNYLEHKTPPLITNFVPFHDRCVKENKDPDSISFGKYEIVVPKGEVFFLGDNRGNDPNRQPSYDCTAFGPQPAKYIEGVAVDIIKDKETIADYVWRKVKLFFSFKWLFG